MTDKHFVSIKDLAKQLGMDRSHARRYVLGLKKYQFHKRRTVDSGGQLTLCVSAQEAQEIVAQRARQGFMSSTIVSVPEVGVFYVIQLVPELDAKRVKLGYAASLQARLAEHRTAAPTAKLLGSWPCKRSWEQAAIDALIAIDCCLVLNEVFECANPDTLVQRANDFFAMFPIPDRKLKLSERSPLNSG